MAQIDLSRREFLIAAGAGATGLAAAGHAHAVGKGAARPPNIVVVLADDLGYADLGCHGAKDLATPHIDSLAADGVRCTAGYVTSPVCSPTRAGLLTGRYQQRFGHEFNPRPEESARDGVGLPRTETTLAERLKQAGYATGMFGKWHLGYKAEYGPVARGFDEFYGFMGGRHEFMSRTPGGSVDLVRGTEPVQESEYLTDAFTREALSFIDRNREKPFFLYLPYNAVHAPLQAPEKYLARFSGIEDRKRRTYAAMSAAMDDGVGAVLSRLRQHGLEKQTLVFFLSDNGGPTPLTTSRNDPLRGAKATVFEGGIRVPFLARWDGVLPEGKVYDKPVSSLDIHATVLAAANIAPPTDKPLDGVDVVPYLTGNTPGRPHETLHWRYVTQRATRYGDMKIVFGNDAEPLSLFNVAEDIGETNDLSQARPEVVKELRERHKAWSDQMPKPLRQTSGDREPASAPKAGV